MDIFKLVISSHTQHENSRSQTELFSTLDNAEQRWNEISDQTIADNDYKDSLIATVHLVTLDTQEHFDSKVLHEAYSQHYVDYIKTEADREEYGHAEYFREEYDRVVVLPRIFPYSSNEVKQLVNDIDGKLGRTRRRWSKR